MQLLVRLFLIFVSFSQLSQTDGYFAPYLLVCILGMFAARKLSQTEVQCGGIVRLDGRNKRLCHGVTVLFTLFCVASNYAFWLDAPLGEGTPFLFRLCYRTALLLVFAIGSCISFYSIFKILALNTHRFVWKPVQNPWSPKKVFWCTFGSICAINLFVLFFLKYPGLIAPDAINQLNQVLTGQYSNWHPILHTLTIAPFVRLGLFLFNDINIGVAFYHVFQVLFMAFVFGYATSVLAKLHAPRWMVVCTGMYYALAPYHITYSIEMIKDTMFGGWMTLFCLVLFRLLRKKSNTFWDYVLFVVTSAFAALYRHNGLLALAFFAVLFAIGYWREKRKLVQILLLSLVCCFVVSRPLVSVLQIPQADVVESLSMPTQQIARAVVDYNDLSDDEYSLLNQAMEVQRIAGTYDPVYSDPIKHLIRQTCNQKPVISSQSREYLKLYINLGLRHPDSYVKAWIDQTKGYWSSGYSYYIWINSVFDNDIGVVQTPRLPVLVAVYDRLLGMFSHFTFLQLLISLGLCTWLTLTAAYFALIRRDKIGLFVVAPSVCAFLTLLLGTPLSNGFRYLYSVFCSIPIILIVTTRPEISE